MCNSNKNCNICLKPSMYTQRITDSTSDNTTWLFKLQNIVPEVNWLEDYIICNSCTTEVDAVVSFRNKCIDLDRDRQNARKNAPDKELYTCYNCGASFDDKQILSEHIQVEHVENSSDSITIKPERFECNKCAKSYTLKRALRKHSVTCNGPVKRASSTTTTTTIKNQDGFKCDLCPKSYTTEKILKAHKKNCQGIQIKKGTRSFSCEICDVIMNFAKSIVAHCVNDHGMNAKSVKPYTCDKCDSRFSSSANLIQHKKYHEGSRSHICSFCGKTYITKSDLTVHEYTHYNRRNYKCECCDKAFNTNKNLRSHKLVVHTDSSMWKYACAMCNKRFPLKSGYDQHVRRHLGDKRFSCHICAKPFVSRNELKKHMGYHSKVKAFRCEHCDKGYKEKRVFEVHLARAHGVGDAKIPIRVKKFACHVCPSTFFDRQKLTRHLCTHSGIKPYGCTNCDRKFTDKYYLKQHLRTAHNVHQDDDDDGDGDSEDVVKEKNIKFDFLQ